MYLSSLLACQGWYCVNSYCVFSPPFPPVCVFWYSLPFTQHLCSCKCCLQCALSLPFARHLHLCKHCLQCAHSLPFARHSHSCKHCLQRAHTLPFTRHSHSCKRCLQPICSMCEKPGLEPEPSLSPPALRAPARPMV